MDVFELEADDWLDRLREMAEFAEVRESPDVVSSDGTFVREVDSDTDDLPFWAL
jgi:hypothetical protein